MYLYLTFARSDTCIGQEMSLLKNVFSFYFIGKTLSYILRVEVHFQGFIQTQIYIVQAPF